MSDLKDPPRLLDASAGAEPGLRDLLVAAKNDVGSDAQVARLAERLGPLLAPPALPAPPVAASPSGIGAALKLGLAGAALIVAGGGAWLLSTSKPAPPSATISPHASAAPASPASSAAAGSEGPAPAAAVLEPAPSEATNATPPVASSVPAKPTPPAQLSEADLLEQARRALKSDPARALARANEVRSRFPGGVLVQEREVIAIQALRQLGRSAEADRRTEAFEKAFPGSAFQRKLKSSP